jgi:hypothetical protein
MVPSRPWRRGVAAGAALNHPTVRIGTPKEYALWEGRVRKFLVRMGRRPEDFERVDARYNFQENRLTLYLLSDPTEELSVAGTISHELLHALLDQLGEHRAARALDLVARPAGRRDRMGGM